MAISRSVRPSVIVFGGVTRVRELRRKSDKSVYGSEVVLQQDSGAQIAVTVYQREDQFAEPLPGVGEVWSCEATVEESRDFGATLIYEGPAGNTLDRIHSSLATPSK